MKSDITCKLWQKPASAIQSGKKMDKKWILKTYDIWNPADIWCIDGRHFVTCRHGLTHGRNYLVTGVVEKDEHSRSESLDHTRCIVTSPSSSTDTTTVNWHWKWHSGMYCETISTFML